MLDLNAELDLAAFGTRYQNVFTGKDLRTLLDIVENRIHELFARSINGVDRVLSNLHFLVIMFPILLIMEDLLLHVRIHNKERNFAGLQRLLDHDEQLHEGVDRLTQLEHGFHEQIHSLSLAYLHESWCLIGDSKTHHRAFFGDT